LIGKVQERYGIAKDDAERQVDEFSRTYVGDETTTYEKTTAKTHGAGR